MIDRLIDYAHRRELTVESGFAAKRARWLIDLDDDGRYLGVVEMGEVEKKRNPGRLFPCAPHLSQPELVSGGVTKCHFLVETAQVVALLDADEDDDKTRRKHDYFVDLLRQAGAVDPRLAAAARALADPEVLESVHRDLADRKAKRNDGVTLQVGGVILVETDSWHDWWRTFRRQFASASRDEPKMLCVATGREVEPAATHPKVKGLADVGGAATGCSLASFDKDAFTSFGLKQSANAAMSDEAAHAYAAALNDILAAHSQRLGPTRVAHWFQREVPPDNDPVAFLEDPDGRGETADQEREAQQRAAAFFQAFQRGQLVDLAGNRYYALVLSGSSARVMVRDWMEGAFEELAANIHAWFQDLTIVHRNGGRTAPWPKFLAVLAATARELDDVPAPRAALLWRVAIGGQPIPYEVMAQALHRARLDIMEDRTPNHARMGLLKAYHLRKNQRKGGSHMTEQLTPYLNEDHPDPAYHCGRLLAVYAHLQQAALGDVGAGVVQRYYAAASATPALVLGRLARTGQFHLDKLESGGLAHWFQQKLASVWGRLGDQVPRTLDLEQQSLFALGYYQQLADLHTKKVKSQDQETSTGAEERADDELTALPGVTGEDA
jgi:CRISPR-associated protein Cas8c/Csd1, subtype I-C/DVULG